jgi:hypothetical protein
MPFIQMLRPKPGEAVEVLVVSARLYGVKCHWVHGRTIPCTSERLGECEACPRPWQWTGFLGAYEARKARYVIVALTSEAYNGVRAVVEDPYFVWRGKWLSLARTGPARTSRVKAAFFAPRHVGINAVPLDFDVPAALCRLWNALGIGPEPAEGENLGNGSPEPRRGS